MPKRTDANQAEIVNGLREIGASVQCLHDVGRGVPDLLVGFHGKTYLLEVKTARGRMTPDEKRWHAAWRGQVTVVRTIDQAVDVITDED